MEKEWTYNSKFDFVVSRYMCGSISDWPQHVKRIHEYADLTNFPAPWTDYLLSLSRNLAPGGWVELQDYDLKYVSDDGTLTPDHDLYKWNHLFLAGLESINRTARPGAMLRSYAEAAGFINIREVKFKMPLGSWPKDPELKQIGMMNLVQVLDGLEAFSLKTLEAMGWSPVEIEVFLASVRQEIKSNQCHSYQPL